MSTDFGPSGGIRPAVQYASYIIPKGSVALEVGVQNGEHARRIIQTLVPKKMILVDMWTNIDRKEIGEVYYSSNYDVARKTLSGLPCMFIKGDSREELPKLDSDSVDFAYIDGDHSLEVCLSDIKECIRIVKIGGVIGGHDYGFLSEVVKRVEHDICVPGAIRTAFHGWYVNGRDGDWWIQLTSELMRRNVMQNIAGLS